ncbi:hypothetical protein IJ670_07600 [bacterium]|nr:hypothetical protein [bacterium]
MLTLVCCAFAFGLGLGVNNVAFSDVKARVATVDVNKMLSASKAVKAAQDLREKDTKELLKWYDSAAHEISLKQDPAQKQALIKKYESQLTARKTAIKDAYAKKLNTADDHMKAAIAIKAKELGYE